MPYTVTGSPLGPFADAVLTALLEDGNLTDIVGDRIVASTMRGSRTAFPYIVGGRRDLMPGAVPMQTEGGEATIWLDFWSELNSPDEVQRMLSRGRAVLSRRTLPVVGFTMRGGSLVCQQELVIPDFDPDMPQKSLYHGVQQWTADLDEIG
jgi:hypothetical protein